MGRIARYLLVATTLAQASGWEEVTRDKGIIVYELEVEDRDLAAFRGVGAVDGTIYEILAVLSDSSRRTEWQHRCVGAHDIARFDEFSRITYNRTAAPWPVNDRDVVLKTRIRVLEHDQIILASFRAISTPKKPKVDDVVRMPYLKGHYKLTRVGPKRTRVEYQVDADPGGWLPDWVANRASREIPIKTLLGLRRQVDRTRGQYEDLLDRWDPARKPPEPDPVAAPAVGAMPAAPTP